MNYTPPPLPDDGLSALTEEVHRSLPMDSTDIVFVGNSITEGFPVAEMFPGKRIKNRGVSGNTSAQIMARMDGIAAKKPGKIFLSVGINDIVLRLPAEQTRQNILAIIGMVDSSSKLYIQSLFPVCFEYSRLSENVLDLNKWLKETCRHRSIEFVDLYPNFLPFERLTFDGVHLNKDGYWIWKKAIEPYL